MQLTILGAGNVGGTLGRRWAELGHEVVFGVRDTGSEKLAETLARAGHNAKAAPIRHAARAAEVVVLAVPWKATQEVIRTAGHLKGKILIDATNPITMNQEGLEQGLLIGRDFSAAEQLAVWLKDTQVVKAFNTVGWEAMDNPRYGERDLSLPLCGNNEQAKKLVCRLAEELGFEPVDVGPLKSARYLEPLAMLWIDMAVLRGFGRQFGFQIMKR